MAYEYNEYLKNIKRFNPRMGDHFQKGPIQKIDYFI